VRIHWLTLEEVEAWLAGKESSAASWMDPPAATNAASASI